MNDDQAVVGEELDPVLAQCATALLGSWPNQVAAWGRAGIAAYLAEVGARGVTPAAVLMAIRSCPADQAFPPSAAELAALARRDPSTPTFAEMLRLVFGSRGALAAARRPLTGNFANEVEMLQARARAAEARAAELHPLVASFVDRYGLDRLAALDLDDEQYGPLRRRELIQEWDRHCEAMEGREVAAIARGHRDRPHQLDPLSALGLKRPEQARIGSGS